MTAMLIALFILYFMATLIGIVCVLQENIYYSKKEKITKILFIIFVPMLGATIEMYLLSRDIDLKDEPYKDNTNRNARVYKFFDGYSDLPINQNESNPL